MCCDICNIYVMIKNKIKMCLAFFTAVKIDEIKKRRSSGIEHTRYRFQWLIPMLTYYLIGVVLFGIGVHFMLNLPSSYDGPLENATTECGSFSNLNSEGHFIEYDNIAIDNGNIHVNNINESTRSFVGISSSVCNDRLKEKEDKKGIINLNSINAVKNVVRFSSREMTISDFFDCHDNLMFTIRSGPGFTTIVNSRRFIVTLDVIINSTAKYYINDDIFIDNNYYLYDETFERIAQFYNFNNNWQITYVKTNIQYPTFYDFVIDPLLLIAIENHLSVAYIDNCSYSSKFYIMLPMFILGVVIFGLETFALIIVCVSEFSN